MKPAVNSKRYFGNTKLMIFNSKNNIEHRKVSGLAEYLEEGDLLIVNESATMPSSLYGKLKRTNEDIEIRLAAYQGEDTGELRKWAAISFGPGDWRVETEKRGKTPVLQSGDRVVFKNSLELEIKNIKNDRVLEVEFLGEELAKRISQAGKPIQYSYLEDELKVWDQQTIFASVPISVEPPSASFAFDWDTYLDLKSKGIEFATILHSAGISSSGDPEIDKMLPFPEYYSVPKETENKIKNARKKGKKIIALGTTVLRALESSVGESDEIIANKGITELKITPDFKLKSVTSLVSGMHEEGASHMSILRSICPPRLISKGYNEALERNYKGHEFGDISLLDCGCDED